MHQAASSVQISAKHTMVVYPASASLAHLWGRCLQPFPHGIPGGLQREVRPVPCPKHAEQVVVRSGRDRVALAVHAAVELVEYRVVLVKIAQLQAGGGAMKISRLEEVKQLHYEKHVKVWSLLNNDSYSWIQILSSVSLPFDIKMPSSVSLTLARRCSCTLYVATGELSLLRSHSLSVM